MAMLDGESAASTAKADKARRKQEKRRRQQQAKREAAEAEARAKDDGVAATATEPAPEPTTQQGVVFATVEPAVEQRGVGSAESPVAAKKKKKTKKKKAQSGLPQVRHTAPVLAKAGVGCSSLSRGRLAMGVRARVLAAGRHRLWRLAHVHGAFVLTIAHALCRRGRAAPCRSRCWCNNQTRQKNRCLHGHTSLDPSL